MKKKKVHYFLGVALMALLAGCTGKTTDSVKLWAELDLSATPNSLSDKGIGGKGQWTRIVCNLTGLTACSNLLDLLGFK
jgi:hypothetical protein